MPKPEPEERVILEADGLRTDVGRYHTLQWGGGQITIPKELMQYIPWKNREKIWIELGRGELTLRLLNP
jgi:hypothetical protein